MNQYCVSIPSTVDCSINTVEGRLTVSPLLIRPVSQGHTECNVITRPSEIAVSPQLEGVPLLQTQDL